MLYVEPVKVKIAWIDRHPIVMVDEPWQIKNLSQYPIGTRSNKSNLFKEQGSPVPKVVESVKETLH